VGWELRGGNRYYYRSVRDGGRVRKEYVGSGEIAEAAHHADETVRRVREAERERGRAEVECIEALVAPAAQLCEAATILMRAELVARGYRRHNGEWRLRRA
jgi:hypothetical protein